MRSVRASNAMLSALTREPSQGRNNQTFTSKRSGSSVENGLEKVHLKKGKQWKVTPKVRPGLRQRGRRKGVNSRGYGRDRCADMAMARQVPGLRIYLVF